MVRCRCISCNVVHFCATKTKLGLTDIFSFNFINFFFILIKIKIYLYIYTHILFIVPFFLRILKIKFHSWLCLSIPLDLYGLASCRSPSPLKLGFPDLQLLSISCCFSLSGFSTFSYPLFPN